jgi:hypothetical protein
MGTVNRDLAFSFRDELPYYALTDLGLGVEQRLGRQWDVRGQLARETLAYRALASRTDPAPTDLFFHYSVGAGYRVGRTVRLGVDLNYSTRQASATARSFEGLRLGSSVSYGLPQ